MRPHKALFKETKLDSGLKLKLESLEQADSTEILSILGKCTVAVDGQMRRDLINAGGDVLEMNGESFTATVSSDDIYSCCRLGICYPASVVEENQIKVALITS
jgi:hypothetical protein